MKRIKQWYEGNKRHLLATLAIVFAFVLGLDPAALGAVSLAYGLAVKAIESQGITLQYSTSGSPSSFSSLVNVTGFSGPGGSASVIDVTNLSSQAKEKLMGLPDEGQFTIDLNLDPDDASHIALRNARSARTRTEFKITFSDATPATAVFYGYVLGFAVSAAVDQQVKVSVTVEIDGAVAWA